MSANENIDRLKDSLRQARNAIIGRGGEISETAGYRDVADAIFNIPADNAITTRVVDGFYYDVPENATKYAYIAAFGGNTYRLKEAEKWELFTCFPREIYFSGFDEETGESFGDRIIIPEEILNLPGFGEGISLDYYNKVDLVNQKYKRCIETMVLDGSEVWRYNFGDGRANDYFFIYHGSSGIYADMEILSSDYDSVNFSPYGNEIGIKSQNTSKGYFMISIRPKSDMTGYTLEQWKAKLAESPITVKVARTVPIETDLPVRINPLLRVWGGKGYIESSPWDGESYPVEVILQTYTQ